MTERYFKEWDPNSGIPRWDHDRKRLNEIIALVNDWTLHGSAPDEAPRLRRRINMGLQTFASETDSYADDLREMMAYIDEVVPQQKEDDRDE